MGLLRRLLRPSFEGTLSAREPRVHILGGREDLQVVGESHYQDNLWRIVGGWRGDERVRFPVKAVLVPEPDNTYDPNAVSVWIDGLKVGYLSRADAERYQPGLLALEGRHGTRIGLSGTIVGGGWRTDGPGLLGVFLLHDPADFGLSPRTLDGHHEPDIRTGLAEALRTDDEDDTYNLAWLHELPSDSTRAISVLRERLRSTTEPISRHYMYCELEARLYRSRDAFASALDEYDEAVKAHDAEIEAIRAAFTAKVGQGAASRDLPADVHPTGQSAQLGEGPLVGRAWHYRLR